MHKHINSIGKHFILRSIPGGNGEGWAGEEKRGREREEEDTETEEEEERSKQYDKIQDVKPYISITTATGKVLEGGKKEAVEGVMGEMQEWEWRDLAPEIRRLVIGK